MMVIHKSISFSFLPSPMLILTYPQTHCPSTQTLNKHSNTPLKSLTNDSNTPSNTPSFNQQVHPNNFAMYGIDAVIVLQPGATPHSAKMSHNLIVPHNPVVPKSTLVPPICIYCISSVNCIGSLDRNVGQ